jgi:hypothetical protein
MKKQLIILSLLGAICCSPCAVNGQTQAKPLDARGLGLGIILGEPTGINIKLLLSPPAAFDLGVAWSFVDQANVGYNFIMYADYLIHFFGVVNIPYGQFGFYCGVGGLVNIQASEFQVSLRIPLGVTYILDEVPLDIFLEIVPGMEIFPQTLFRAFGGLGVHYLIKW